MALSKIEGRSLDVGQLGNRNLIINGAMQVAQRGTSFAISGGAAKYTVDRYFADISTSTSVSYTVAQSSDAPSGFTKSVGITVNTSGATGSNDYAYFRQIIEGYNFEHLNFGSSVASSFTLSFWVKSSVTGVFGLYFGAALNDRFQVATYTISSANTWEYKTVTIAGDTTGTWATGNSVGLQVAWSLSCGSAYLGATGSWGSSLLLGATGQTNITETSGATFYITGVQLEVGDTSTPFEHRSIGQELQLCYRYYYQQTYDASNGVVSSSAYWATSTGGEWVFIYPQTMRAAPTITIPTLGALHLLQIQTAWRQCSSVSLNEVSNTVAKLSGTFATNTAFTQGGGSVLGLRSSGSINYDAEL